MKTFRITCTRQVVEWQEFSIDAESIEEAEKQALEDAKDSHGWQYLLTTVEPEIEEWEDA